MFYGEAKKINCRCKSVGVKDFVKVRDGSRRQWTMGWRTFAEEGVGDPRSYAFGRLTRLGCREHAHVPSTCIACMRKVEDILYMMPACPGSGGMCLLCFPCVFLYVSLLGKLGLVHSWLTLNPGMPREMRKSSHPQGHPSLAGSWAKCSLSPC